MNINSSNAYTPPESLWQFIKSEAEEQELDAIKSRIGASLIETNIDLHNEIDTLLEIWRDYRNDTLSALNQGQTKPYSFMPEPPNIRETIKKEITFFVKQIREQCKTEETFCRQIINNKHNLNVINYVLNASSSNNNPTVYNLKDKSGESTVLERPQTSVNKYGEETPLMNKVAVVSSRRGQTSRRSYTSLSKREIHDSVGTNSSLSEVKLKFNVLNIFF